MEGYAAILATVLIWSTPSLFQFYLNRYYDPWAQNFYRYSVACLAVVPFVFFRLRPHQPQLDRGILLACLIPALPNVVHQIAQNVSLFHMGPGVYAIFIRSSVIITTLLALIFFPEERWIIRQWQFQAWHAFRVGWRRRRPLVSTGTRRRTHRTPGNRCRLHRQLLLGALQRPGQTPLSTPRPHPHFRLDQFHHFGPALAAHSGVRNHRDPVSCRSARERHPHHLGRDLHQFGPRPVLHRNPQSRSRALADVATPMSRGCSRAFRALLWRTAHRRANLQRRHSALRRVSHDASEIRGRAHRLRESLNIRSFVRQLPRSFLRCRPKGFSTPFLDARPSEQSKPCLAR